MKITIDTKEDSKEEITKAIQLLSNLVSVSGVGVVKKEDLFSSSSEEVNSGNAFASMFGGGKETEESNKDEGSAAGFNLDILSGPKKEENEEKDEETPRIISY